MFISANPRYVSNGCFESFIPYQRVESLHQRLVEMTNNDVNAWSVFRPVSATVDGWDDQGVDFNCDENFPSQSLYGRQYQETYSTVQQQTFNFPKTTQYAAVTQGHTNMRPSTSQRVFQTQATSMNCVDNGPMLGNDYAQWNLGRGHGSFAEFSKTTNAAKNFQYQSSDGMNATSFTTNSSIPASMSSYTTMAPVPIGESFSIDRTSPSTAYSSYSSNNTLVEPSELIAFNTSAMKDDWWQSVPRNCKDPYHADFDAMMVHDGLPRYAAQPQNNNHWSMGTSSCGSQLLSSDTVSPKDILTLEVPLAMSTSGSSQGTVSDSSDSSPGYSSRGNTADYSGSEKMSVVEQPTRRHRHMLPTAPEISRGYMHVPVVPSNDIPTRNTKRTPSKAKPPTKSKPSIDDSYSPSSSNRDDFPAPRTSSPDKTESKPTKIILRHSPKSAKAEQPTPQRSEQDDFLINCKLAGMSYKEIRRKGKFTEAESTLRGRFRTLTKHKTARVRKPVWDDNDIRLLKKAVRKLTRESDTAKGNIPWKLVAEYIAKNGGSYHFGNATCRKRWDELQASRRMGD